MWRDDVRAQAYANREMASLTPAQQAAMAFAGRAASNRGVAAIQRIEAVLNEAGVAVEAYPRAIDIVRHHARVVVHLHPDRMTRMGNTVAEGLLESGLYRNQYETGISTGSTTAYAGGQRDQWEMRLFGGAYHQRDATVAERPKYGALELVRFPDGPIPRFGCCYFVLNAAVTERTTFTFGGSEDPHSLERLGTADCLHPVMAALLEEVKDGGVATPPWPPFRAPTLGIRDLTIERLLEKLNALPDASRSARSAPGRVLDSQIEAQIHGDIRLDRDVDLLTADPSFRATPVGDALTRLADRYDFALEWHGGFALSACDVPEDFRGPDMPGLARRIVGDSGTLTAATIGAGEASIDLDRRSWLDWGTEDEIRLRLKQLWHVVVHHGLWNGCRSAQCDTSMIRIDQALPGTLVFLPCGCGGIRGTDDPLARLPRLVVQHPCGDHHAPHVRVLSKSTLVSPFARARIDEA